MRALARGVIRLLAAGLPLLLGGCEGGGGPVIRFMATTPHQEYEARLREAGLDATALGRDWIAAADQALAQPIDVSVPHLEARYLDPTRAQAVAYRVHLERGQRLVGHFEVADARPRDVRLFVDIFFLADSARPPQFAAAADSSGWELEYVALRPGGYLVRVQPELLRGGRVTITLAARASLGFPVLGKDMAAIRSGFGAERDGGRREHQGVDIFAPRGTPVVAAAAGLVARVNHTGLGGNVVWLREARDDRRLYYAHLDRQAVSEGMWVEPGDTLGWVGNTGNARTTSPHLHFGIYMRGVGPVDPHFHLLDPPEQPEPFAGDPGLIGGWARISGATAALRTQPSRSALPLVRLPRETPLRIRAGIGTWYEARLPDGREGYVAAVDAGPLDEPIESAAVVAGVLMRVEPLPTGTAMDAIAGGEVAPVLGRFGDYALVRRAGEVPGWIDARSRPSYSIGPPFSTCGTPSVIHFGAGVPMR